MKHKLKHVPQVVILLPYYISRVLCDFTFLSFVFSIVFCDNLDHITLDII